MARKPSVVEAIEKAKARAVELDALVLELEQKEKDAVAAIVRDHPGENPYKFGTVAERARKDRRAAREDRERVEVELDALAVERARELAGAADAALAAAIKGISTHRPALEKLYAEAGVHVHALAELWVRVKGEIEGFDSKVSAGQGLAAAAVTNLDAQSQWNAAAWALSDLGPLPVNVAYFVEIVLAAALDPGNADEYRINAMRAKVGIPDISGCNVPAHFSGDRNVKRGGSSFADSVQTVAMRNEPKPEPAPPTEEQLANARAAAAEQERLFKARRAHETTRRGYVNTEPRWPAAAPVVDPDADPGDPTGLGLSEAQRRELGELQTR
jgi:hypothetical protein